MCERSNVSCLQAVMNKAIKWITDKRCLPLEHRNPLDEEARLETKAAKGVQMLRRMVKAGTLPQSTIDDLFKVCLCTRH